MKKTFAAVAAAGLLLLGAGSAAQADDAELSWCTWATDCRLPY